MSSALPSRLALVGRDDEVRHLTRLLAAAEEGTGQLAVVRGEGGIGKTRLLEEVLTVASRPG